jgi:hypothetical protein
MWEYSDYVTEYGLLVSSWDTCWVGDSVTSTFKGRKHLVRVHAAGAIKPSITGLQRYKPGWWMFWATPLQDDRWEPPRRSSNVRDWCVIYNS